MDNNFSQIQKEEIVNAYITGDAIDLIIDRYDSSEHCIREVLKEYSADRRYNYWKPELYERMEFLYKNGRTMESISYDLLISKHSIGKILVKRDIKKRTYSERNRKYYRNSYYFDNINTPNKAYVLGLISSDGNNYIKGSKSAVTLSLQEEDVSILERVKEELEYEGPLKFISLHDKNNNHKNQYALTIVDNYMCCQLRELGVVQRKSLVFKFPTFLRPDLIRHFVRGYFDGDGCIYYDEKRKKGRTSLVGTLDFCQALQTILLSMFVKNNIIQPAQSRGTNIYVLQTAANLSSFKFLSWLYQDCDMKMERKYQQYLDLCERYQNPKVHVKSF